MKIIKNLFVILFLTTISYAQDDLLKDVEIQEDKEVTSAFKALKIVNLESTKLAAKGDFYLVIAHRFGYVKNGFDDLFGLDAANTRIQMIYGVTKNLSVHFARDKFRKTYDFAAKYNIINQEKGGFPVQIVGFNSLAINSELKKDIYPNLEFTDRLAFVNQLLISRKFSDDLSLQIAPTYLHENLVSNLPQKNSQYMMGFGGRYKLTKRWSINADYIAHLNRASGSEFKNPLSIGFDLETGGHVFQMFFSNSRALHESGFLANTDGSWGDGQIAFGFNLVRVF
jgi:hypothetical protein